MRLDDHMHYRLKNQYVTMRRPENASKLVSALEGLQRELSDHISSISFDFNFLSPNQSCYVKAARIANFADKNSEKIKECFGGQEYSVTMAQDFREKMARLEGLAGRGTARFLSQSNSSDTCNTLSYFPGPAAGPMPVSEALSGPFFPNGVTVNYNGMSSFMYVMLEDYVTEDRIDSIEKFREATGSEMVEGISAYDLFGRKDYLWFYGRRYSLVGFDPANVGRDQDIRIGDEIDEDVVYREKLVSEDGGSYFAFQNKLSKDQIEKFARAIDIVAGELGRPLYHRPVSDM